MAKIQNKQKPIKYATIDKVNRRVVKAQKAYDEATERREADIVREEKNHLKK